MGLLSAISDSLDGLFRAAPGPPGAAMLSGGWYGGPMTMDAFGSKRAPTPYQLVESYKSLIYACCQINDNAVSRCKLRLYADAGKGGQPRSACGPRRVTRSEWQRLRALPYCRSIVGGPGDVHEVTDHPAIDTLDHPDPEGYFDRQQLLSLISRYCDVVGAAYLKPDGSREGLFPAWLWPLAAQYVITVSRPGTPLIDRYTYFTETYQFDELLRFRNTVSLRDPYKAAYSPTYAAIEYAGLEDQYVSIQTTLLSGGARPSTAWVPTDPAMPPGDQERRRFEVDLDRQHARGNAGKHIVTNGAYTPHPLSYSPADLSGLDLSKYDMERTANCFGIPMPFLTGDTNLANLQAAREQHAANAVEPRCKMIAAVLTRLCQKYDPRLFWAFDPAVPEDEERKAKIAQMRLGTGQTTINEENEEAQWLPKTWGDAPWLPGTLKQPDMITEAHEQGMETAKAGLDAMADAADDGAEDEDEDIDEEGRDLDLLASQLRDKDALGHGSDPHGGVDINKIVAKLHKKHMARMRRRRKNHAEKLGKHKKEISHLKTQIAHVKEHGEAKQHYAKQEFHQKLAELQTTHHEAKSHLEQLKAKAAESDARIAELKAKLAAMKGRSLGDADEGLDDDPWLADALAAKSDDGSEDRGLPAVHAEAVDARFDAVLAAMEREMGL